MPLFLAGLMLVGLTGCEQAEQTAIEALEQARQPAVQALDEVRRAGAIDEARQRANDAMLQARQKVAGLLDQASGYLSADPQGGAVEPSPAVEASPAAL